MSASAQATHPYAKAASRPPISYADVAKKMEGLHLEDKTTACALKIIQEVHRDDIHALVKLSGGHFLSGSKDGAIKKWNASGELDKVFYEPEEIDYRGWITAVKPLTDGTILTGTRDGYVWRWSEEGEFLGDFCIAPQGGALAYRAKQRNLHRITSLALSHPKSAWPLVFIGRPTLFSIYNQESADLLGTVKTSGNDWVYSVTPLSERSLAVVTGTELEVFSSVDGVVSAWDRTAVLISAQGGPKGAVRPFISYSTLLEQQEEILALSLFNGGHEGDISLELYDLNQQKILWQTPGHTGRAWMIETLGPHRFASCGDEGTVKLWDSRQKKQTHSFIDNPTNKSRVSALAHLENHTLVSASCPDDIQISEEKARFCMRDIRLLK